MGASLSGLHVVLTGAGGGLGPAVRAALESAGAVVHAPARRELDLADEAAVIRYYAELPDLWASIHVAGGFAMSSLEDTSLADFQAQWTVNALTAFLCCREAVRRMKRAGGRGGRIVNVGSQAAMLHPGGKIAYVTAKDAVAGMTLAIATEVRAAGVLVNAVLPGTIDTPANRAAMPGADYAGWTAPSDIASAIAWLASPENRTVTGSLVPV